MRAVSAKTPTFKTPTLITYGLIALSALFMLFAVSFPARAEMHGDTAHEDMAENVPHAASVSAVFSIPLIDNEGNETGVAVIENADKGSLITVEVMNVSSGWHAFHIHETGDCSDMQGFASAGGHAAFGGQKHGLLDEEEIHAGDMPNVWVGDDGTGKAQIYIQPDIFDSLNDTDGSAFVMHAGADDYRTDPAGAAGGRIACGVIFPPVEAAE